MTNPYRPPSEEADEGVVDVADSVDYVSASKGQRFVNLVVDYIAFMALAFVLGVVMELTGTSHVLTGIGDNLFGIVLMLAYYLFFEATFGRTPGKLVTGTKVVDENGGPARFWQILGRTVARFAPFEPLSFFGSRATGWHDRWSHTCVVRVRK